MSTDPPLARDGLVALGHLVAGLLLAWVVPEVRILWWTEASFGTTALTVGLACLPMVLRRRHPLVALAGVVAVVAGTVVLVGSTALGVLLVLGDLLYCAVLYTRPRAAWSVAGCSLGVGCSRSCGWSPTAAARRSSTC